jgi:hypothetical protein
MRPEVPEDVAERVEALVDEETRVPAASLPFGEQLDLLVEIAEERKDSTNRATPVSGSNNLR